MVDVLLTVFAQISGTVKVLFEDVFELLDLLLFLIDFLFLLLHLLFVWLHELHDHILELDDLFFHTGVEWLWFLEVILKLWDGERFSFDDWHEFVDDEVRHLDDFLFEEVEFRSESRKYCFKV